MSLAEAVNKTVPIDPEFFYDGHFAVLLSQSLGGSGVDPHTLSDTLGYNTAESMNDLLGRGIGLPIFFGGDCALDGATHFVLGELDEMHETAWIGRLTGRLSIPCGKLFLLAGGGDGDELRATYRARPRAGTMSSTRRSMFRPAIIASMSLPAPRACL